MKKKSKHNFEEELDATLERFVNAGSTGLNNFEYLQDQEFQKILSELKYRGYIEEKQSSAGFSLPNPYIFKITDAGIAFNRNSGFKDEVVQKEKDLRKSWWEFLKLRTELIISIIALLISIIALWRSC